MSRNSFNFFPIFCLFSLSIIFLSFSSVDGRSVEKFDGDLSESVRRLCPRCKSENRERPRRDISTSIADLAREFLNRGGVEAIRQLMTSDDKIGVLKNILGYHIQTAVLNGVLSRVIPGYRAPASTNTDTGYNPPPATSGGNGGGGGGGGGNWDPEASGGSTGSGRSGSGGSRTPNGGGGGRNPR